MKKMCYLLTMGLLQEVLLFLYLQLLMLILHLTKMGYRYRYRLQTIEYTDDDGNFVGMM